MIKKDQYSNSAFPMYVNEARRYINLLAQVESSNPLLGLADEMWPRFPDILIKYETSNMDKAIISYVKELKEAYETALENGSSVKENVMRQMKQMVGFVESK